MNLKDKARELAEVTVKIEELSIREAELKKELFDAGYNDIELFSDLGRKVILTEGRSQAEHDIMNVLKSMTDQGLIAEFPKITKIIQSYVTEKVDIEKQPLVTSILLQNAKISKGEKSISCRKMTKEDLKKVS